MFTTYGMLANGSVGGDEKLLVPQDLLSDSGNKSSYTFSAVSLGETAADRSIFVVCCGSVGGSNSPSSCLVAGVSATRRVVQSGLASVAIFNVALPSGTSGDIVLTFSRSMARCGGYVFAAYGLDNLAPVDSGTDVGGSANIALSGLDTSGFVLAVTHGTPSPYENVNHSYMDQIIVQNGNIDGADTVISYAGPGIGNSLALTGSGGQYTRYAFAAFG